MGKPREDVLGHVYGRLTVIGDAPYQRKTRQVQVRCECGRECVVSVANLKKGTTTSCGCYHKEQVTRHGQSFDRFYKTWHGMMERCQNPNHVAFARYGGAGISVCPEWQEVSLFLAWAHSCNVPEGWSLDRIDNELGYSPNNCRWVTRTTQQRNRSGVKGSTSQYVGVCLHARTKRWKAHIRVNKVLIHLGYYTTELEAAIARDTYIVTHNLSDFTLNGVLP